jgi:hypothetical protein
MRGRVIFVVFLLLGISGCTMHPLEEQVTGLPLHDVVFKIECEAQEAVRLLVTDLNLDAAKPALKALEDRIKAQEALQKPWVDKLSKLSEKETELIALKDRVGRDSAALADFTKMLDFSELLRQYKRIKDLQASFNSQVVTYYQDLWRAEAGKAPIATKLKKLQEGLDVAEIAKLITFYKNAAAFSFRFLITETDQASATNLSYRFPLYNGTFTVGLAAGDTKDRESDRNAKLVLKFRDLDDINCAGVPDDERGLRTRHYPIRGAIGLREVFLQFSALQRRKEGKFATGESYTDQIKFTTTLSASVNPTFTISPTPVDQVSGTFSAGATRKDQHSVQVSLTGPSAPDAPTPVTRVEIVQKGVLLPLGATSTSSPIGSDPSGSPAQ